MKEYIEKDAFKQYLLDLKKQVNEIMPGQNVISGTTLSELIDRFPAAADVQEVVRCRECKHREDKCKECKHKEERGCVKAWCKKLSVLVDEDFYCGLGETDEVTE